MNYHKCKYDDHRMKTLWSLLAQTGVGKERQTNLNEFLKELLSITDCERADVVLQSDKRTKRRETSRQGREGPDRRVAGRLTRHRQVLSHPARPAVKRLYQDYI